jgi:hypothetical protein
VRISSVALTALVGVRVALEETPLLAAGHDAAYPAWGAAAAKISADGLSP